jgi:hypothetical protein
MVMAPFPMIPLAARSVHFHISCGEISIIRYDRQHVIIDGNKLNKRPMTFALYPVMSVVHELVVKTQVLECIRHSSAKYLHLMAESLVSY